MAFGSVSTTVAITSIASSFDNQCPLLALPRLFVLDQSISTRSEFSLRPQSPRPCAQNERSCFHRALPLSSRRPAPLHRVCRHSPWARSQSPCLPSASCPGPHDQNSA